MAKLKAGIIGATGYTGQELVRLLVSHPEVVPTALVSQTYAGKSFASVYPSFNGVFDAKLRGEDAFDDIVHECDVLFFALPHGLAAQKVSAEVLGQTKIIDLGADFRLKDARQYERWYELKHPSAKLLQRAVYGLCEWRREDILSARLIANPGCYATCSLLTLLPLAAAGMLTEPCVVDAKSGVSGAGRAANLDTHFNETNETIKAYKVASHRHTPEIEQELNAVAPSSLKITFTPHLIPMDRGILVTAYTPVPQGTKKKDLYKIYQEAYGKEPFIRVLKDGYPETRWVRGSNYCDIACTIDERTGLAVLIGALDNLVKGAAGQAIQNMNILFGFEESAGLKHVSAIP